MKTYLGLMLVIVLGIGLGIGVAALRTEKTWWTPDINVGGEDTFATDRPGEPKPKLVIDKTEYDFGTLDMKSGGKHDFVFTNAGEGPLKLVSGSTSCRCTTSDVDNKVIPPGGSDKVTISWKPAERVGPYQQTAKILTNDPARPEVTLTVSGKISAATQVYPSELVFSRVSSGEAATAEARLLCYLDEQFGILDREWSDKATAEYFDVDLRPLTAEELKQWPTAKSGYLATITVKPGLPQGPFRRKLTIRTSLSSTPKMELRIEGIVGSEIAVVGPGWDADKGVLTIGAVSSSEGAKRRLMLIVRGADRREVSFKPVDVSPSAMKVGLGERREINRGAVVQTPLLIDIPPDSPTVNCLGSDLGKFGEIILETTHPQVPKLRILVRMAIEK
ncbi:MAG: DUF1573 domain-containing protein [Planctomycetes bacterium]|nr:DUF1573 domain-containing protein [Planctomycetota bacterium]MBU4397980.1 DUF1573 domain-containing protein [Planctomycetota bacterium]MCG2683677.1 DUF1573 domain-containing protein [Planctomycetales bacterium]